jgi:hypothetical protein
MHWAAVSKLGIPIAVSLPGTREKYGDVLAEAFAELREYRREHAGSTLKATEEKPLAQFLLPRDAMSILHRMWRDETDFRWTAAAA